ncbi:MAG: type I pantothenate kinase [Aerococcaceae bacterium]|nr:type I pantothenate kinase [Aerococcaceae bacterium]
MELEMFTSYSREDWHALYQNDQLVQPMNELEKLVSLNDRLSEEDVQKIYVPLVRYLDKIWQHIQQLNDMKQSFLSIEKRTVPFIIGVSGSVSVGKSTTARVLRQLLAQAYPDKTVELMTTDGFLYATADLKKRGILNRKGFPESYDMPALIDFMVRVKTSREPVSYPQYSHEIYDIIPDKKITVHQPDILIVEGINVLQLPQNQRIYVSDFFDVSIYIDAEPVNIQQWYMERFDMLLDLARQDTNNYYYRMSQWPKQEAHAYAYNIWQTVNLVNLIQNIEPTRERANLILHKTHNHLIDTIYVRNY